MSTGQKRLLTKETKDAPDLATMSLEAEQATRGKIQAFIMFAV
jgi:hypothetical protein